MSALNLVPRDSVYRLYWYFAAERQAIFDRRARGEPGPWTDDPILAEFKFCNTFRAADRVSQHLIRDVIYDGTTDDFADLLFRIVAFRLFSKIETWEHVRDFLGRPATVNDLLSGDFVRAIESARLSNGTIYTGAFILCANDAFGQGKKHLNHVALLQAMFSEDDLPKSVERAASLAQVYEALREYPLIGDFMAYQMAIDINYSELTDFPESSFVKAGPGALRGVEKVFVDTGGATPERTILWMVENQETEFDRLGLPFDGLFGRRLQAIDCQGLFCEVDKYCREAAPELKSARSRIKQRFTATPTPLSLFFPPKWGINDALPDADWSTQGVEGQLTPV